MRVSDSKKRLTLSILAAALLYVFLALVRSQLLVKRATGGQDDASGIRLLQSILQFPVSQAAKYESVLPPAIFVLFWGALIFCLFELLLYLVCRYAREPYPVNRPLIEGYGYCLCIFCACTVAFSAEFGIKKHKARPSEIPAVAPEQGSSKKVLSQFLSFGGRELRIGMKPQISDSDLAALSDPEFVDLRVLDLSFQPISDKALQHLSNLPRLTALYLNDTRINGSGFPIISKLPQLRHLYIERTQVHDYSIKHFLQVRQNLDVYFRDSSVTAAGLNWLRELSNGKLRVNERDMSLSCRGGPRPREIKDECVLDKHTKKWVCGGTLLRIQ